MANPRLTNEQLNLANSILEEVRERITELAAGDEALRWALRRKVAKELVYDERGKPNHRSTLKALKRQLQDGLCPECGKPLPDTYCVLDRKEALLGYTAENTRLLCQLCDHRIQKERGFC